MCFIFFLCLNCLLCYRKLQLSLNLSFARIALRWTFFNLKSHQTWRRNSIEVFSSHLLSNFPFSLTFFSRSHMNTTYTKQMRIKRETYKYTFFLYPRMKHMTAVDMMWVLRNKGALPMSLCSIHVCGNENDLKILSSRLVY